MTDEVAAPSVATYERPADWPTISYTLQYPISTSGQGEEPLAVITIAEPDLEAMERVAAALSELGLPASAAIGVGELRPLIAALSGIPDAVLKRIHFRDAVQLLERLAPLLEDMVA
jgi:hypothetical protein